MIKIQKDDRIRECNAEDFEFFEAQGYSKVAAKKKPAAKKESSDSE